MMIIRKASRGCFAICTSLTMLFGCASSYDYNKDGYSVFGGGFRDNQLLPGFYYIKARSNLAIVVSHDAAERTWRQRAEELCKPSGYVEIRIHESVEDISEYRNTGHPLAARDGYALCKNFPTTYDQAIASLDGAK
jgi:hypothetical protein